MLLFYATRDGQARLIATKIAATLGERNILAAPHDLAQSLPTADQLESAPLLALVASVRYGRHLQEAEQLLALHDTLKRPPPLALASVNLTARKAGKDTADGNAYLRKWIARHRHKPAVAAAIAGRLDYPRYDWLDRQMIRLIMKMTGGPTDPRAQVEYTSWPAVVRFAEAIANLHDTLA
jgi:menaquinone-dependent protoporphyrinogen oxidase